MPIRGLVETFRPLTTKPTASADMQEKDIFVSLKNTNKSSSLISTPATILTDKANAMLIEFLKDRTMLLLSQPRGAADWSLVC